MLGKFLVSINSESILPPNVNFLPVELSYDIFLCWLIIAKVIRGDLKPGVSGALIFSELYLVISSQLLVKTKE